jgi:hypothetical protein
LHSPQSEATWKSSGAAGGGGGGGAESGAVPLSFSLTHEAARDRVWSCLKTLGGVDAPAPESQTSGGGGGGAVPETGRPKGHGTHNLLVKDKKTKRLYLFTLRHDREVDLKTLGDKVGAKELRLAGAADVQSAIASTQGCVTPLWMVNNVQASITPVFDKALLDASTTPVIVCAGCRDAKDHSQHNVVKITPAQMIALIQQVPGAQAVVPLEL